MNRSTQETSKILNTYDQISIGTFLSSELEGKIHEGLYPDAWSNAHSGNKKYLLRERIHLMGEIRSYSCFKTFENTYPSKLPNVFLLVFSLGIS